MNLAGSPQPDLGSRRRHRGPCNAPGLGEREEQGGAAGRAAGLPSLPPSPRSLSEAEKPLKIKEALDRTEKGVGRPAREVAWKTPP